MSGMTREEAIQVLKEYRTIVMNCLEAETPAYDAAIEALSADAENRHYIRIYADDEPSVKAEKLYQICGETQNREVAEWLKEYFPSTEAVDVVRCKDCKASRVYGKTTQWLACESVMEGQATDPDGYCYFGERREDAEA